MMAGDGVRWQAVTVGDTAYLRIVQGRTVVVAADFGQWRRLRRLPGRMAADGRVRRTDGGADITARVGELEVNTTIDPAAFAVTIPPDFDPMTIDELRSVLIIK